MSVAVAVVGATGRLGRVVCDVVESMQEFSLHSALNSSHGVSEVAGADIVVDATHPAHSEKVVDEALAQGAKVLVGTSGWSAERLAGLTRKLEASPSSAVLVVPNFSVGSVIATAVASKVAAHFESIEIIETHHLGKVDSPSGTALRTAEKIAEVRRARGGVMAPHSNQSARGELVAGIPVHSLRLAGVVAKQEVIFGGLGETVTIGHETTSSDSYRPGIEAALRALVHQEGLVVGLEEILGLAGLAE